MNEAEDRTSALEDKEENLDERSKENEIILTHRNVGHYQKTKSSNYRHKRGRRIPEQWHRADLQQDHRSKLSPN